MKADLFRLLIISITVKLAYLLMAIAVFSDTTLLSLDGYTEIIKRHDAGWFENIAKNGYPAITKKEDIGYHKGTEFKQSSWAFFPFYPWLLSKTMTALRSGYNFPVFLWSIIFSSMAFAGFYLFASKWFNASGKAFYATLVFILFPFHFYFSMAYTEAAFFVLLIFSFLSVYHGQYYFLPLLLVPLVLTRPNGITCLIPLLVYYMEMENLLKKKNFSINSIFNGKLLTMVTCIIPAVLAFAAFCVYQNRMTGYYFAFSIAQQGWYKEFMFPLLAFFRKGDWPSQFYSVYSIMAVLFSIYCWKKLPLSFNLLIWINLLLPLTSGSVTSMQRYISIIFPLTFVLGNLFYKVRYKKAVPFVLFSLQLLAFYFWLIAHPFSY